jgi:DNA modification methylase
MQRIEIGNLTLINGDSKVLLPEMEDESFDFILTDPPYGLNKVYGRSELGHRACVGDETTELGCWTAGESFRLLRPNRWCAVFCGWSKLGEMQTALRAAGLDIKSVIAWDKTLPGLGQGIRNQYEMIVLARKGKPAEPFCGGNVWRVPRERGRPIHPNQKPVALLQQLILYYGGGGNILDPFAGAASVLVAAHGVGAAAIGIEIEEHVYLAARERLLQLTDHRTQLHLDQQNGA